MAQGNITGLAHIGVFVKDLEVSTKFYQDILGLDIFFSFKCDGTVPVAFAQIGTCILEIVERPDCADRTDGVIDHIAFAVENIEAVRDQLAAKGIEFIEKEIVYNEEIFGTGAKWILFRGPDGEHLEITEKGPF